MFPVEQVVNVAVIFVFLIFWLTAFVILYHLTRFGVGILPKRLSAIFLVGAVILFSASVILHSKLEIISLMT
jgi:hypothetical protein